MQCGPELGLNIFLALLTYISYAVLPKNSFNFNFEPPCIILTLKYQKKTVLPAAAM